MSDNLDRLRSKLQRIERTRQKIEILHRRNLVNKTDLQAVYEGLFIQAVTAFEAYLENHFYACLLARHSSRRHTIAPRVTFRNLTVAREFVLRGDDYSVWIPFSQTEKRAKIFLKDGVPFSILDDGDRSALAQILLTRNAIAHQSAFATDTFKKKVVGTIPLPPRERTPVGFLRSQLRSSRSSSRFEFMTGKMMAVATRLDE